MKTTKTVHLYYEARQCDLRVSQYDVRLWNDSDYVWIASQEVTFEHDEFDANARQLASLKIKLEEVRAENQQRENAILLAISKLQALEWEWGQA